MSVYIEKAFWTVGRSDGPFTALTHSLTLHLIFPAFIVQEKEAAKKEASSSSYLHFERGRKRETKLTVEELSKKHLHTCQSVTRFENLLMFILKLNFYM